MTANKVERVVGRLTSVAAGWKLRALELEKCGAGLSGNCLRECAGEIEALLQDRPANRTSWYAHEDAVTPNADEIERLRALEAKQGEDARDAADFRCALEVIAESNFDFGEDHPAYGDEAQWIAKEALAIAAFQQSGEKNGS